MAAIAGWQSRVALWNMKEVDNTKNTEGAWRRMGGGVVKTRHFIDSRHIEAGLLSQCKYYMRAVIEKVIALGFFCGSWSCCDCRVRVIALTRCRETEGTVSETAYPGAPSVSYHHHHQHHHHHLLRASRHCCRAKQVSGWIKAERIVHRAS